MLELVDRYRETHDFHGVARAYFVKTPAVAFVSIVWECPRWPGIVMTFANHPFDDRIALGMIRHVNAVWDGTDRPGMTILRGLTSAAPTPMNAVVLLRPPHLYKVGTVDPALDPHTAFCFPAYGGEFSGDESADEFDDLIHTIDGLGCWAREPVKHWRV